MNFKPERLDSHTYALFLYHVTENGLKELGNHTRIIRFVRGSRIDEENTSPPQTGFVVEQLLELAKEHLKSVNVGELEDLRTNTAINLIDQALAHLQLRAQDRKGRGVQGTYQP